MLIKCKIDIVKVKQKKICKMKFSTTIDFWKKKKEKKIKVVLNK